MPGKRVLIAGVGPLPRPRAEKLFATGLRLWGFADALERRGHEVLLAEAGFAGEKMESDSILESIRDRRIRLFPLDLDLHRAAASLRRIVARESPDCIVTSTDTINTAAALAKLPIPHCADFNGHPMAERQMQAATYGFDEGIEAQWRTILPALLGADRFIACSHAQRHALAGELGLAGRLNRHTAATNLVETISPSLVRPGLVGKPGAIRGVLAGHEDFVALYTGGYNTWTDEETIFRAVENAMGQNPKIRYLSTGGAIAGHDDKTFARFKQRVEFSPYRDRFVFVGWVPTANLPDLYLEADLAITADKFCYEGVYGARNRLFEWIDSGLPVALTPVSEVPRELAAKRFVFSFACGDWEALSKIVVNHAFNTLPGRQMAQLAAHHIRRHYNAFDLAKPLADWVDCPESAPDLPPTAQRPSLKGLVRPQGQIADYWERYWNESAPTPPEARTSGWKRRVKALLGWVKGRENESVGE